MGKRSIIARYALIELSLRVCKVKPMISPDLRREVPLRVDRCSAVQEDEQPDDGRKDQHLGVEAEPAEVEADLVAQVPLDQWKRLALVPAAKPGPF